MGCKKISIQIGIIGAGAWGTTLAKVLADNGHSVTIWAHNTRIVEQINNEHQNKERLPNIVLPSTITATISLKKACIEKDLTLLAIPSQFYEKMLEDIKLFLHPNTYLLSATKGINKRDNRRFSEVLFNMFPIDYHSKIAILSGPNISREIALEQPSTTVISSKYQKTAEHIQKVFNNHYLRVYTNTDVIGTELGGTLKNIIAIAAGILDELKMGDNIKAAIMVRGLVEMARFASYFGAKPETIYGLTGMGDLITTCSSTLSRNHYVGKHLGKGTSLPDILKNMTAVAEGISTCKLVRNIAQKHHIEMPITEQIYQVLFQGVPVLTAIQNLMTRKMKPEV